MAEFPNNEMTEFPADWYVIDEDKGWVVCAVMPKRGRGASCNTSCSLNTTSNPARSSVSPRTST